MHTDALIALVRRAINATGPGAPQAAYAYIQAALAQIACAVRDGERGHGVFVALDMLRAADAAKPLAIPTGEAMIASWLAHRDRPDWPTTPPGEPVAWPDHDATLWALLDAWDVLIGDGADRVPSPSNAVITGLDRPLMSYTLATMPRSVTAFLRVMIRRGFAARVVRVWPLWHVVKTSGVRGADRVAAALDLAGAVGVRLDKPRAPERTPALGKWSLLGVAKMSEELARTLDAQRDTSADAPLAVPRADRRVALVLDGWCLGQLPAVWFGDAIQGTIAPIASYDQRRRSSPHAQTPHRSGWWVYGNRWTTLQHAIAKVRRRGDIPALNTDRADHCPCPWHVLWCVREGWNGERVR